MDNFSVSTRAARVRTATVIAISLWLSACTPAVRAPGPALRLVSEPPRFADDADRASLEAALRESLRYFARLPPDRVVAFGNVTRTAADMRTAFEGLAGFLATGPSPNEIGDEIGRRFEI